MTRMGGDRTPDVGDWRPDHELDGHVRIVMFREPSADSLS